MAARQSDQSSIQDDVCRKTNHENIAMRNSKLVNLFLKLV